MSDAQTDRRGVAHAYDKHAPNHPYSHMYERVYWDVQRVLDEALGTAVEDGSGEGLAGDVQLLSAELAEADSVAEQAIRLHAPSTAVAFMVQRDVALRLLDAARAEVQALQVNKDRLARILPAVARLRSMLRVWEAGYGTHEACAAELREALGDLANPTQRED